MIKIAARLKLILVWTTLGIIAATFYGILNDQITLTISPEYFSVYKREQFNQALQQTGMLNAPLRMQAVLIGSLATWWFGMFLGLALSISGIFGCHHELDTTKFLRAVVGIMSFTFLISVIGGVVGFFAELSIKPNTEDWPFLAGIHNVRMAFVVGFWHDGAYLGGFLGTLLAGPWLKRERTLLKKQSEAP